MPKNNSWSKRVAVFLQRNGRDLLAMGLLAAAGIVSVLSGGTAQAFDITGLTDLKGLVKNIAGVLGFIVAIYGGISFGLGLSQDNPDAQSRGLKMLVGGIVIMGASVLASNLKLTQ